MNQVRLFNTLSRTVEVLTPISPGEIKMYCCGPTVYNFQHIGNLRTYLFEDVLVRTLRYAGYKVKHVMNITDVGHLVSDADEGEDKMLVAARREGKSSHDIAEYYTKIFFDHCNWLNIKRPDVVCKATEHIPQMIEMIEALEHKGCAYKAGGNVYYDVAKFPEYGKLAKLDLDALQAGARIEVDSNKHHPLDFALWFTNSKFEGQELQWDSPWGRGYPGWHIECSAMSAHYLGEEFDIHCGGIDHIPVHHTNEIAQSQGATGKPPVRVWMHGGFLVLSQSQKMSKSTGEFLTLDLVKDRGFDPLSYRWFCFSSSYRNELAWSWEALEGASNSLKRVKQQVLDLQSESSGTQAALSEKGKKHLTDFRSALFEDLGVPRAVATLHAVLGDSTLPPDERLALVLEFDEVLGMGVSTWSAEAVPGEVVQLAEARLAARSSRDWKEADRLREEIQSHGYSVEDTKEGFKLKKL